MSEATTGVADANAWVKHHAEALAADRGRSQHLRRRELRDERLRRHNAENVDPLLLRHARAGEAESEPRAGRLRSRAAARPVRAATDGQARSRTGSPLRGSCRPMKTTRCSRLPGSGSSGSVDAVRDDLERAPDVPLGRLPRLLRDGDSVVDPGDQDAPEDAAPAVPAPARACARHHDRARRREERVLAT